MIARLLKAKGTDADHDLQMTPMIDVTFLLLVFFLCSIKFKMLDGKLNTYLPKDVGVNVSAMDDSKDLEKIEIKIQTQTGLDKTGSDNRGRHGFSLRMNGVMVTDLKSLFAKVKWIAERGPDVRAVIHTGKGVEYDHVVKTVNELLRAGITQISFVGR